MQSDHQSQSASGSMTPVAWPGFQPDGGLLLPVPSSLPLSGPGTLESEGALFVRKPEFHITLLNRAMGSLLRDALGEEHISRLFADENWTIRRTGEGHLLRKIKVDGTQSTECESIIERLDLPALAQFRQALGRDAGMMVPDVLPHVTLYTAGDAAGIGLPDSVSFDAAHVTSLRLPGICNRKAPHLPVTLLGSYEATDFVIDGPALTLRVGQKSAAMDAELRRQGAARAIVVTAYNPFSETAAPRANGLRQGMLRLGLHQVGLTVRAAVGTDPAGFWPPEPSLLVTGTDPELEDRLLRDYEQHAIVVVEQGEPVRLVLHPDHRNGHALPACGLDQGRSAVVML